MLVAGMLAGLGIVATVASAATMLGWSFETFGRSLFGMSGDDDLARSPRYRALVDAETSAEAVRLIRRVCREGDASDALMVRLLRIFKAFEPRERSLQRLSLEQQRLSATGGVDEFAVCVVYTAMMLAISEGAPRHGSGRGRPARPLSG